MRAALPWALAAAAIIAQQVGSKALRDGVFLTRIAASELPHAMLLVAGLSVPIVLGTSAAMVRVGPARVTSTLLLANAVLFFGEWLLLPGWPNAIAWALYLHVACLGGTLVSAFFSSFAECFDPHAGRRAISRVLSGAAAGGLLGGLLAGHAVRLVGERGLLLALVAVNVACALSIPALPRRAGAAIEVVENGSGRALSRLRRSSYLRGIAALVLLSGFVSAILDYGFKVSASNALGRGPELTQLFANFYTATAVLTTLLQTTLADRALARLGLGGTLSILPASVLLGGAASMVLPGLSGRVLLRGISSVVEGSLFRSAYEPLYTPLSPNARRSTKTIIDVAAGRLGEALGSAALLAVPLWIAGGAQGPVVVVLAMAGAVLLGAMALRLHAAYVSELTTSLRSGAVRLEQADARDGTTRMTLSLSHAELERSQLLAQIAALRGVLPGTPAALAPARPLAAALAPAPAPGSVPNPPRSEREASAVAAAPRQSPEHLELVAAAADLLSAQRERVLRRLEQGPLDPRLAAFAIPLLEHTLLVEPVTAALKTAAPAIVGQLVDALHDKRAPLSVRRRIPRILKAVPQPRAAQGLIDGLREDQRELRFRSALALGELTVNHPELGPARNLVFEAVRAELHKSGEPGPELRHLFAVLGLALERAPLRLARRALVSGDVRQRGTALEYLHNVVPEPLRTELLTHLEQRAGEADAATRDTP